MNNKDKTATTMTLITYIALIFVNAALISILSLGLNWKTISPLVTVTYIALIFVNGAFISQFGPEKDKQWGTQGDSKWAFALMIAVLTGIVIFFVNVVLITMYEHWPNIY